MGYPAEQTIIKEKNDSATFNSESGKIFSPLRLYPTTVIPNSRANVRILQKNFVPPHLSSAGNGYPPTGTDVLDLLQELTKGIPLWANLGPLDNDDPDLPDVDNIIPVFATGVDVSSVPNHQLITESTISSDVKQTTKPTISVTPGEKSSCQQKGCEPGSECVFENSLICPVEKGDIPCQCQKGCRMQHTFISLGASTVVDECGSKCFCDSLFREVHCTQVPCGQTSKDTKKPF